MALFSHASGAAIAPGSDPRSKPEEVLEAVREQTCYSALRGLINFIFVIILISCAVTAIGGVIEIVRSFDIFSKDRNDALTGIAMVVGAIFAMCIAYAGRQAAFVLIDIADLLVAQRADSQIASSDDAP